jgi:uncharacterized protein YjdB
VKKFFSFTIAIFLLISMVGLVGCNGLWDFDDDDDVAPTIAFKIPGQVALAQNAPAGLLAQTTTGFDALTGRVLRTSDDSVMATGIDVADDGTFTANFSGFAGGYYVEISNTANTLLLYVFFDNLNNTNAQPATTVTVNEETTAVGMAILAAKAKDSKTILKTTDVDKTTANWTTIIGLVNTGVTASGTSNLLTTNSDDFVNAIATTVTGVTLNKTTLSLVAGSSETLTATVAPADATFKGVTWSSSNTSVATVDTAGKVTAVGAGTANITVTTDEGAKTAVCAVTVTAASVAVTGVTLNKTTTSIAEGSSETLIATVAPATASNKAVTWTSSDAAVATVDATGKVTGKKAGTATITVTTVDGSKTATCVVTVTAVSSGTTNVTLGATVSGKSLSETIIKIDGVDSAFTTTTSLVAADDKTWVLEKDSDLTTKYGTLVLIATKTDTGASLGLGDGFTAYKDFNSMVFSTALPAGSRVTVLTQNTAPATELATSGTL